MVYQVAEKLPTSERPAHVRCVPNVKLFLFTVCAADTHAPLIRVSQVVSSSLGSGTYKLCSLLQPESDDRTRRDASVLVCDLSSLLVENFLTFT